MHPLPFRSIAVCIGVRTAILHRCSHLAFFLVCHSDDRLRTSSLVRAVIFFVVQGVCCCFTMPATRSTMKFKKEHKYLRIKLNFARPLLEEKDFRKIWIGSGRKVKARFETLASDGETKLVLQALRHCDDAVLQAAGQHAMDIIEFNDRVEDTSTQARRKVGGGGYEFYNPPTTNDDNI